MKKEYNMPVFEIINVTVKDSILDLSSSQPGDNDTNVDKIW